MNRWIPDQKYRNRGLLIACLTCLLAFLLFLAIDNFLIQGLDYENFVESLFEYPPFCSVAFFVSLGPTLLFGLVILHRLQKLMDEHQLTLSKATWMGAVFGAASSFILCILFLLIPTSDLIPWIIPIIREGHLAVLYSERVITVLLLGACAGMATSWYAARYLLRETK